MTVREKLPADRVVVLDTACANQNGEQVLSGTATVIAPAQRSNGRGDRSPTLAIDLIIHGAALIGFALALHRVAPAAGTALPGSEPQ